MDSLKFPISKLVCAVAAVLFMCGAAFAEDQTAPKKAEEKSEGKADAKVAKSIPWVTSYKEGLEKAKKEKKPIFIDFMAEWCGWCKRLDEEVYADASAVDALKGFVCIKVDVDKQTEVALAYDAQSLPKLLIVNVNDEIVGDQLGYVPLGTFLEFISGVKGDLDRKTGGTKIPEVKEKAAGKKSQAKAEEDSQPLASKSDEELVVQLADPDAAARAAAAEVVLQRPNHDALLVATLGSDYLGARVTALEVLKKSGAPSTLAFDPWAPRGDREAALATWKKWANERSPATSAP